MAVGEWVACSSFGRALTGHLTADSLVLAANKTASSITGVSRETSEAIPAHASSTRNEGSGEFLFRASGRHPNIRVPVVETLFLRGLNTFKRDEAALPCVERRGHIGRECCVPSGARCTGCAARLRTLGVELIERPFPSNSLRAGVEPPLFGLS